MQLVAHGLYTVKDRYFTEFGNGYWVDNKQEGRPYYYLFQDTDGVDWVIPISSQVDNYKRKIATVYKGNIIKNLIMDCQSYTKYRPNETTGGIFVSWRRKEELPTGA